MRRLEPDGLLRCRKSAPVSQLLVYETCSSRARDLSVTLHWRHLWSRCRLDRLAFLVCGLNVWQNAFFACWCWHFDPACPHSALVPTHLSVPRSSSAARWWCNWAVGTHYWAALQVFDQTFCWCCFLCGVERDAIHDGPKLARGVDGFLGLSQYFIHPRLHNQEFLIWHCLR